MCRKMIKDPLGSSQILVKCFLGSMNISKLVMKPVRKVEEQGHEWHLGRSGQLGRQVLLLLLL